MEGNTGRSWSRARSLVFVGVLVVASSALYAHDLFIKLDSYFLSPNTRVRISLLNGTFSLSENAVTADRVLDLSLVSGGLRNRLATTVWLAVGDTTFLNLQTQESGTYLVGVSTKPRELGLSAVDFNEYLEHDGIPDILEERRRSGELARNVVERYHKHVKAVFQVGSDRSDDYESVLGYPAEIVPLENPYGLEAPATLLVRCLVDGRPVTNQLVIAGGEVRGEAIAERSIRTDIEGVARIRVDRPGKWYVKFIHMAESPASGIDYESKWATLTFEIQ